MKKVPVTILKNGNVTGTFDVTEKKKKTLTWEGGRGVSKPTADSKV